MGDFIVGFVAGVVVIGLAAIADRKSDVEMSKEVCEYINEAPCKITFTYKPTGKIKEESE